MDRGFSLVETLLTLAISSAMAAVALPSLSSWRDKRAVRLEAKRLELALERAYAAALSYQQPLTMTFDNSKVRASISNNQLLYSYSARPPVKIRLKSTEQTHLTFYPSHTTTPTTLLVTAPSGECSVILSLRGRTRRECP